MFVVERKKDRRKRVSFQWWKYFCFKCVKYLIVLTEVYRPEWAWLTYGLWSLCVSLHGNRAGGRHHHICLLSNNNSDFYALLRSVFLRDLPQPIPYKCHLIISAPSRPGLRVKSIKFVQLSLSLTHFAPLNKIGDDTIEYLGPGLPVTARPARNGW